MSSNAVVVIFAVSVIALSGFLCWWFNNGWFLLVLLLLGGIRNGESA